MQKQLTPILKVDEIESSLAFWQRLGYECTVQVPHDDRIGFVILVNGSIEIMLQTFASALADVPEAVGVHEPGSVVLYLEVDDLDEIESTIGDAPVVIPRRTTDYGSTEIFVRSPSGHVVGFAKHQ